MPPSSLGRKGEILFVYQSLQHSPHTGQPRSLSVTTRHVSTKTAHFEQFC